MRFADMFFSAGLKNDDAGKNFFGTCIQTGKDPPEIRPRTLASYCISQGRIFYYEGIALFWIFFFRRHILKYIPNLNIFVQSPPFLTWTIAVVFQLFFFFFHAYGITGKQSVHWWMNNYIYLQAEIWCLFCFDWNSNSVWEYW